MSSGRVKAICNDVRRPAPRHAACANVELRAPTQVPAEFLPLLLHINEFLPLVGRPSFNALQNYGSGATLLFYYVFDVLTLAGQDVTSEQLARRRELLQTRVLSKLDEPIRESPILDASLSDLIRSVKAQGLEGIVAKRLDSRYEPGLRSGMWQKMRVNQGQEFVIGGYTASAKNFDALIFGYYRDEQLIYAARTRNGFTPASREKLFRQFRGMEISQCPFANLPEAKSGRWGQGLTAEKMKDCRWLSPALVGQFEFLEWTPDEETASHYTRSSNRTVE
jgi:bifunctional non-homologous end joining protein LigD